MIIIICGPRVHKAWRWHGLIVWKKETFGGNVRIALASLKDNLLLCPKNTYHHKPFLKENLQRLNDTLELLPTEVHSLETRLPVDLRFPRSG